MLPFLFSYAPCPITNYQLPITNALLPITNALLPITHYPFSQPAIGRQILKVVFPGFDSKDIAPL